MYNLKKIEKLDTNLFFLISTFLISLCVSYFILPVINKYAVERIFLDYSDARKQQRKPIVRIGGLGLIVGIFTALFFVSLIGDLNLKVNNYLVLLLSFSFFLIGFADDLFNLSPWPRLISQVFFSSLAWSQNIRIDAIDISDLHMGVDFYILPRFLSLIITVIWIVGITNAINWIDGLDGLAIGISFIAVLTLGIINFRLNKFDELFLFFAMAGSCISFMKYNFFPAKILMGDGGSYFLGFLLSFSAIITTTKYSFNSELPNITSIFIPICLFLIPIMDMVYVIFKRIFKGRSPFFPDKDHIHHRLMRFGFSHRNTVFIIYSFSILSAIITISMSNKLI